MRGLLRDYVQAMDRLGMVFKCAFGDAGALGFTIALARYGDEGRRFVVVDSTERGSACFESVKPGDELCAVNGAAVVDPDEESIEKRESRLREIFRGRKDWFGLEPYDARDHAVEAYVEEALFAVEILRRAAPGMNGTLQRWEQGELGTPAALLRSLSCGRAVGVPVRWLVSGWKEERRRRRR